MGSFACGMERESFMPGMVWEAFLWSLEEQKSQTALSLSFEPPAYPFGHAKWKSEATTSAKAATVLEVPQEQIGMLCVAPLIDSFAE